MCCSEAGFFVSGWDKELSDMKDESKTKKQLINELKKTQRQLAALGKSETGLKEMHQAVKVALEKSEERYRRLVGSVTDYTYFVRIENGYSVETTHSPACVGVTGYTAEEYNADQYLWFRMVYPDDREAVNEQTRQILSGRNPPFIEHRIIHKNGSIRWVRNTPIPFHDAEGRLVAYEGMVTDITERKQAEESEAKYRSLASTADLMYLLNKDCRYLFMNEKYLERLGLPWDQVIGKTYGELHSDESTTEFARQVADVFETGTSLQHEHRSERDGRYFLRTFSPVKDREGNTTIAVTVVSKDITARKHAEEELLKTLRELREARYMLIQSEKLAAVGQLAAGVSHEILNPINIISMRLQLVEMTESLSDEAKESMQICRDQVARITKITKGLSQFTRVSEKQIVTGDLNQLIDRVVTLVVPRLKVEKVRTIIRYQPNLPPIQMDKDSLEQIVLNVISNALDAMNDRKEKTLRISTECKGKKVVRLVFSDNGIGIKPEMLNKIFDPFFTTKEPGKGTGLGLFISYRIIQDHDGKIWAKNNKWGGASFFIELPVKHDHAD